MSKYITDEKEPGLYGVPEEQYEELRLDKSKRWFAQYDKSKKLIGFLFCNGPSEDGKGYIMSFFELKNVG